MKKKKLIKNMTVFGMLIALTVVLIMSLRFPIPFSSGAYIHLGDVFIYLGATLSPLGGFLIGSIGMAISDLVIGAVHYSIVSLIIHGLQGLAFAYLYNKKLNKATVFQFFLGAFIVGLITIVPGYYFFDIIFYGNLFIPLIGLLTNIIQVFVSSFIAAIILKSFKTLVK